MDEFLSSDNDPSSDAATGEAFIEDDYTTDYSVKQDEDFQELDLQPQEQALQLVFDDPDVPPSQKRGKGDAAGDKEEEFKKEYVNGEANETQKLEISVLKDSPNSLEENEVS